MSKHLHITLRRISLLIVLLSLLLACDREKGNATDRRISFSEEWQFDSLGCLGIRDRIVTDSFIVIKGCEGMAEHDFLNIFGKPNGTRNVGNQSTHSYWLSCGLKPDVKGLENNVVGNPINTEATQLLIRIDEQRKVNEIRIIEP